jgi:hypothetical protein
MSEKLIYEVPADLKAQMSTPMEVSSGTLMTEMPANLRSSSRVEIEVTGDSNSVELPIDVFRVPTLKRLGGQAIETSIDFKGDPSRVPGHPAFEAKQEQLSNLARSEAVASTAHVRQY